jgi:type IV secretory pathway protease TraF
MEPVLKPIAPVAGDVVAVTPTGLFINGFAVPNSEPLEHDGRGRQIDVHPPEHGLAGVDQRNEGFFYAKVT